jgi:hypothetical protein
MRVRAADTMTPSKSPPRPAIAGTFAMLVALALVALAPAASGQPSTQAPGDSAALYAETFDAHWEALQEDYPYFEMYGVDWEQERADHRPRAIAAGNDDEFAWELARLFSALPDPHLSFIPSLATIAGRWSYPELDTHIIGRRIYVTAWPEEEQAGVPPAFADDPHACPEIIAVRGELPTGTSQILAAGPLGTTCDISLRWPDGTETEHALRRPDESNLPPPDKHYGDRWLVTGRVGSIGYLRVKTFSPEKATLGPDGKMTTMLRAALVELGDTDGLVLDLQGNGGGMVAASDPFLGNFLERSIGYRWGNSGGKRRVIMPRTPRYEGEVVALVDERSASGGEWAARILRDAGRATGRLDGRVQRVADGRAGQDALPGHRHRARPRAAAHHRGRPRAGLRRGHGPRASRALRQGAGIARRARERPRRLRRAGRRGRPPRRRGRDQNALTRGQDRSRSITLVQAATKSFTNFCFASSLA